MKETAHTNIRQARFGGPFPVEEFSMTNNELDTLPQSTLVTEYGETVYDFESSDFGNRPEWQKEDLIGQPLIIRGLSEDTYERVDNQGKLRVARSVRYNRASEPRSMEPWGMLFTDPSVAIDEVRKKIERGQMPFLATLAFVDSTENKGQSYWKFVRFVRTIETEPVPALTTGRNGRKSARSESPEDLPF